jgi:glutamyl-tRNA reductase
MTSPACSPRVVAVGIDYRSATLEVREKLALEPPHLLRELIAHPHIAEAFLLSTCNRTELYAVIDRDLDLDWGTLLCDFLAAHTRITAAELKAVLCRYEGAAAVHHLFRVAAGLESMVLGEMEIVHQVKKAAELAQSTGTTGPVLQRLIDSSLAASKAARSRTRYDESGLSVAALAVRLCQHTFSSLSGLHILVLGAGEMAELTVQYLAAKGVGSLRIANRTFEHAERLAETVGGQAVPMLAVLAHLAEVDVVICCTASPTPIITAPLVTAALPARGGRRLLLLDLAVPRDVAPDVPQLPGVLLHDLDALQESANALRQERREQVELAEGIVAEEVQRYLRWLTARKAIPTMTHLQTRMERIRVTVANELIAALHLTGEQDRSLVEHYTRILVKRVLHGPLTSVKELACSDDAERQLAVLHKIFALPLGECESSQSIATHAAGGQGENDVAITA